VFIAAKAGAATVAGQDIQMAAAELIHFASGQDTHIASGGPARIHTGQSIGILGGAVGPGSDAAGKGVTMIAGAGDIDIQAQSDAMQVAAKQTVSIQSQSGSIDCAAPKRIVLATKAGASVTLEGGNIVAMCPGKITIMAGVKSFSGPQGRSHQLPVMPKRRSEAAPGFTFFVVAATRNGCTLPLRRRSITSCPHDVDQSAVSCCTTGAGAGSQVSERERITRRVRCVASLEITRTFWKATILHAEHHRPLDLPIRDRFACHYADFEALWRHPNRAEALARLDLLQDVVRHKSRFFASGWTHCEIARPGAVGSMLRLK
jgi:uncharacterized protein (DUF2345 family)